MISLIYGDKEINVSENILKISDFINVLYEDGGYDSVELTSNYVTDDVLHYFKLWFNELDKIEIVKYERENVIFKPFIFKECDIKTLIDVFNFSCCYQIRLLCETIGYILSKNDIIEHESKYYMLTKQISSINEKVYVELCEIHLTIVKMILKYMSKEQFEKQPLNIQSLIKWKKIFILEYFSKINEDYDEILSYGREEIYDKEFREKKFKKNNYT